MSTEQQEQSAEERIGSMIGKIFVLALIAFFLWGLNDPRRQAWVVLIGCPRRMALPRKIFAGF